MIGWFLKSIHRRHNTTVRNDVKIDDNLGIVWNQPRVQTSDFVFVSAMTLC